MALLFPLPPMRIRSRFERLHRSIWRTKYVPYTPCRLACTAGVGKATVPSDMSFPTPLKERNASFTSSKELVDEWRVWARERAKRTSVQLSKESDLPTLNSLFTEIDWILEDTVASEETKMNEQMNDAAATGDKPLLLHESLTGLRELWTRRLDDRVPLQYLTATSEWRDLTLVVTPAVLIPRPETELMVDFVQKALRETPQLAKHPWVDLGTGSGALAIAVAKELEKGTSSDGSNTSDGSDTSRSGNTSSSDTPSSNTRVHAVDLSPDAAAVARHNVSRNKVDVTVHEGSWFEPLIGSVVGIEETDASGSSSCPQPTGTLGGVVSNPPYIPNDDMKGLQPEVGLHEPHLALDGGNGPGLDSLLPIIQGAATHLIKGGFLVLETNGGDQAVEVAKRLNDSVFVDVEILNDYTGVGRFVSARKA